VLGADWRLGYAYMLAQFRDHRKHELYNPEFASQLSTRSEHLVIDLFRESGTTDPIDSTLYVDANLYLPDDLLVKVDIASMAVALEARSPMVDHEFMEFVARLPSRFKMHTRSGKLIFKRALKSLLPAEILERSKKGFGVPLDHWFRKGLSAFMRETLLSKKSLERGYFNPNYLRLLVEEHSSGKRDWHHQLWTLLMLELWHQKFIDTRPEVVRPFPGRPLRAVLN
jgi:asparagine synthase (glutamine-hydrolysing)